jgi:hypothetical protein
MREYTYPHAPIDVLDDSSALRESRIQRCLHRPLVFFQGDKGPTNIPVWVSGAEAVNTYGLATFDMFGKFYHNEQCYLEKAIFPYHGAWCVRLADPNATRASMVVELHVTEAEVTQYERDSNGALIKDGDGNPRPLLDQSNQVITEPGYKFKVVKRQLQSSEKLGFLSTSTVVIGGISTTIYPLLDVQYRSVGASGNDSAIRMHFDWTEQDENLLADKGALTFKFQVLQHVNGSSIATPVRDFFGAIAVDFMAKPNQVDERVQMRLSFDDKLESNFYDAIAEEDMLPFEINLYSNHFKAVGDLVAAVETNDMDIVDGWMVNILSGTNLQGNPYYHVEMDRTGDVVLFNENYNLYLEGGTDGDISRTDFEERIKAYLTGAVYPEIIDNLRYPFTHIYDVGYGYETKVAILLFMAQRDDFRPSISSQDISMDANTREEDQSLGAALRAKALLTPESTLYGTPCCRAEIFCHAGYSTDPQYKNLLPLTYWAATRRAETQGSMWMRRTLGGQPTSIVDMIKKINYTEYDPKVKQLKFDSGLNYVQYADEEKIFFPDIRAVYTNTTSVLAGASYVDALIHLKYICRWCWATYTGMDAAPEEMYAKLQERIAMDAYNTFGTLYRCNVFVDQTEEMMKVGDEIRVTCDLWGHGVFRRMRTIIVAKRTNFSSASTTLNA